MGGGGRSAGRGNDDVGSGGRCFRLFASERDLESRGAHEVHMRRAPEFERGKKGKEGERRRGKGETRLNTREDGVEQGKSVPVSPVKRGGD